MLYVYVYDFLVYNFLFEVREQTVRVQRCGSEFEFGRALLNAPLLSFSFAFISKTPHKLMFKVVKMLNAPDLLYCIPIL
jgi:hypothetical protein